MGKIYNSALVKVFSSILLGLVSNTIYAQTTYTFNYTGASQTLAVQPGSYSIQCWGGNGGDNFGQGTGGKGGYATGSLNVTSPTTLYIYVGGKGITATGGGGSAAGGFNGGGTSGAYSSSSYGMGSGGGASHIAFASGVLSSLSGNQAAVKIVAAGGGGAGSNHGGSNTQDIGGNGGGLTGGNGQTGTYGGTGGSQTAGGTGAIQNGAFGQGGNNSGNNTGGGGGGGWYGGGAAQWEGSGGGSSYIGGVASATTLATGQTGFITNPDVSGNGKVFIKELCSVTMSINGISSNTVICSGNTLTLTTNGVANYSWSTGSTSSVVVVTPTVTTVYTLSALSPSNCTSSAMLTVTVHQSVPSLTVVNTAGSTGGICPGKSVTLTATGATTYTWNGAQSVTNAVGFNPTVTSGYTVTGGNACGTSTAATSLSIHPLPTVGAAISQPTICSGQTFTPTGTGNATVYVWSNNLVNGGSNVATATNVYTVTGTSALSCTNTATVALQVVQTPILAPVLSTVAICNNGSQATITASGATNYTWVPVGSFAGSNANSIVVNPTTTTTYTLHKSNSNCFDTKVITLQVNQLPVIYAVSSDGTVCANRSATLTAGGGISYTWTPTGGIQYTAVVAPSVTTVYTVAASDGSCISSNTVEVYTNPNPTISVAASATQICAGESSTITLSGANSYTWSDPNITGNPATVTPTISTLYSITGVNGFNCTSSINQVVIVNPLPVVTAVRSKTLVCAGFPSTLTAGGADTYTWSAGALVPAAKVTTVYPTVTTVYTVTGAFNATQCRNTKTVEVAVFHPTFVASSNTAICQGGSILLSASAASNYTWMFPGGSQSVMPNIMVSPSAGTEYTVVANNWSPGNYVACLSAKTVSVGIYTNPTVTAMAERTLICRKESVNLVGGGGSTYVWSHGASGGTVAVSPLAETKYTVTGTDIYNCVNTATILVRVSACPGFGENQAGLSGLSVYPNPNNGNFVIKSEVTIELQLRNQLGQVIETYMLDENTNYQANVNNLADGIYFVTGTHQGQKVTQKIIISK